MPPAPIRSCTRNRPTRRPARSLTTGGVLTLSPESGIERRNSQSSGTILTQWNTKKTPILRVWSDVSGRRVSHQSIAFSYRVIALQLAEKLDVALDFGWRSGLPFQALKFPALTADETRRRRSPKCLLPFSITRSCSGIWWKICRWGSTSWMENGGSVFGTGGGIHHRTSVTRRGGTSSGRCGAGLRPAGQPLEWRATSRDHDPRPADAAAMHRFLPAQEWTPGSGENPHAADPGARGRDWGCYGSIRRSVCVPRGTVRAADVRMPGCSDGNSFAPADARGAK